MTNFLNELSSSQKKVIDSLSLKTQDYFEKLEKEKEILHQLEDKFKNTVPQKRIKLNVGGQYFSTSTENLTREANTFFSVLLSGRWELKLDEDGALFIDRSPRMFQYVLDFMRNMDIHLETFSEIQRFDLLVEAEFFQIHSLIKLLKPPLVSHSFSNEFMGSFSLTDSNKVAKSLNPNASWKNRVISQEAFEIPVNKTFDEIKVRIDQGANKMIGIAPREIITDSSKTFQNCGFYLFQYNGKIYGDGNFSHYLGSSISIGSVVSVILHKNGDVSFGVDGVDKGVAFKGAWNKQDKLYLVVLLFETNSQVTLV